jgi:hypothetical protein
MPYLSAFTLPNSSAGIPGEFAITKSPSTIKNAELP